MRTIGKQLSVWLMLIVAIAIVGCTQSSPDVVERIVERTVEVPVEVTVLVERERIVEVEVQITATPAPEMADSDTMAQEGEADDAPQQPVAPPVSDTGTAIDSLDYALIAEVWELLQQQFDGDLPSEDQLTEAVIVGLLESLGDEFTRYIPPDVAARLREDMSGTFEGIGAFVETSDEEKLVIIRPIAGQPAAAAGILPGDAIIAVDGENIVGFTTDEAVNLVRGPRGTSVVLTIEREGVDDPFDVTIVRARIEIPIVESEMLDGQVGYVRLSSFASNAESQLVVALEALLANDPVGIIFDLRDNGGGFLDQSVRVADLFLPESVVLIERDATGFEQTFRANDGGLVETLPLVVLVNAGSASASEIVAGAIQDNERGTLIGETTFGKGSVQRPNPTSNGAELRVTIARWYTPNDQTIDGEGITPDINVVNEVVAIGGEDDTQLQRAIDFILNGE